MASIKLTGQLLKYISLFEGITNTSVKDCFESSDTIYFIVDSGLLVRAIGRGGSNIKRMRDMLKRNVKVVEHFEDTETFIRSVFHGFEIRNIRIEERTDKNSIAYIEVNPREKGKIIGRDSRNLKLARDIIQRYKPIDLVIV